MERECRRETAIYLVQKDIRKEKEGKKECVYPTGEKNAEQINTKDLFNQHDNVLYIDFCKCKTKNFRIIKKNKKNICSSPIGRNR